MCQSAEQLRRDIDHTRGSLSETLDAIGDRVSPGRMIERRKNRVLNGIQTMRERVMGTASDTIADVTDGVSGVAGEAVDTIKDTPEMVRRQTQGNPLAAGAVAVGVGVLLASIFPASTPEQRAAGQLMDKAEPLTDELRHAGQEMAEHIKEPARDAIAQVKEAATEGAQAVTESAKDAAGTTSDTARDATATVQAEATRSGTDRPPR
jgi:hypothetical protein